MGYDYRWSASKLSVLNDCPRCFWKQEVAGINRPRGIFPSLPGGIDLRMKEFHDKYRGKLPAYLAGKVTGVFYPDINRLQDMRKWQTFQTTVLVNGLEIRVIGGLDDLFVHEDRSHSPWDNKTKGSAPKDDGAQYYQIQSDIYALLLDAHKFKISGKAYYNYVWPVEQLQGQNFGRGTPFLFDSKVYVLSSTPEGAMQTLSKAVTCVKGDLPEAAGSCEYCKYFEAMKKSELLPFSSHQNTD